jgi:pyruvate dehydrogenase E2 component (dihydrolipoamide acetyltransferase)
MRFVVAGGLRIRVADTGRGSGPPLVLIHGLAGSIEVWEPLVPLLAAERRTLALDLPGHGHSDKPVDKPADAPDRSYGPDALRRVIEDVLAVHDIARAVWIGNSIGGQIALGAALAGSPRLSAAILINPTGVDPEAFAALLRRPGDIRARAGVAPTASLLDAALSLMFADPEGTAPRRLAALRAAQAGSADRAAHARAVMHVAVAARRAAQQLDAHLASQLDRLRVPLSVVWGEADRLLGAATPARLAAAGVPVARIPGAGHMPQLEAPDAVHRAIAGFLRDDSNVTPENPALPVPRRFDP